MIKVIILNHELGCIEVRTVPDNKLASTKEIDQMLTGAGYKISQISWMLGDRDGVPVFYDDEECPTYTL